MGKDESTLRRSVATSATVQLRNRSPDPLHVRATLTSGFLGGCQSFRKPRTANQCWPPGITPHSPATNLWPAYMQIRRVPEYYANLIQHLNFRQSLHYPKGRFDGYDSQPMFPVSAEREFNLTVLDTLLTLTSPKNTTELAAR